MLKTAAPPREDQDNAATATISARFQGHARRMKRRRRRSGGSMLVLSIFLCSLAASAVVAGVNGDGSSECGPIDQALGECIGDLTQSDSPSSSHNSSGDGGSSGGNGNPPTIPEGPCYDVNPNCVRWSKLGECSRSSRYMNVNCRMSCNLCNPSMTLPSGVPQMVDFDPAHLLEMGSGRREERKGNYRVVAGGDGDIVDGSSSSGADGTHGGGSSGGGGGGEAEFSIRRLTPENLSQRTRQLIHAQEYYLNKSVKPLLLRSSSENHSGPDAGDAVPGTVIPELCKNRHPHCALWAVRGHCELSPAAMKESCAPVCHSCWVIPEATLGGGAPVVMEAEGGVVNAARASLGNDTTGAAAPHPTSPFFRKDMVGIWETMEENRVVASPSLSSDPDISMGQLQTIVYRVRPKQDVMNSNGGLARWKWRKLARQGRVKVGREAPPPVPVATAEKTDAPTPDTHTSDTKPSDNTKTDADRFDANKSYNGPYIAQFNNFLSPTECTELLDLIRLASARDDFHDDLGDDAHPRAGDDGFALSTSAMRRQDANAAIATTTPSSETLYDERKQPFRRVRQSSRVFFARAPGSGKSGQQLFPDIVETLLKKLELIAGVPAMANVEMPIQYDRFQSGEFQEAHSHFLDAKGSYMLDLAEKSNVQGTPDPLDDFAYGDDEHPLRPPPGSYWHDVVNGTDPSRYTPRTMKNARVFGFVLCLSDVGAGGEVVFPNMGNFTIQPTQGRAILYPTTMSLVGMNSKKKRRNGSTARDCSSTNNDGGDGECDKGDNEGVLLEDIGTMVNHRPVQSGTKYTLTLYLRRYPHKYNDYPE